MSILVMTEVFRRRFGSCARKGVALKLADHADDNGKGIWPSLERLAASCDVSESTARRILAEFVEEGLLVRVKEGGQGPGSTNRYDFNLDVLKAMPDAQEGVCQPCRAGAKKGVTMTPLHEDKGVTVSDKGVTGSEKGCHGDTQTIIEPSDNHHSQRAGRAGEREGASPEGEDRRKVEEAFKRFAPTWPTWVSDSAAAALKAWHALPAGERERAAEMAPAYLAAERASGRTKTCALAVYLTERRWEKLPEGAGKPAEGAARLLLAPWGKAWMAHRLWLLENLPAREWKPGGMMARWAQEGRDDLVAEPRRRGQRPVVAQLDTDAQANRGARLREGTAAPQAEHFVRIRRGSEEWQAWEEWHHARDWPWIDPPPHVEWIYVPAATPQEAATMEAGE